MLMKIFKTKEELSLALQKLQSKGELQVKITHGWHHSQEICTTWDVEEILDYDVFIEEETEYYYSDVKVKVEYGVIWTPFYKLSVKGLTEPIEFFDEDSNSKSIIFLCWSPASDAGKDLVADILNEEINVTKIKFSRAFKTPLETWLGIAYGSLDNKEFRKTKVINPVTGLEESFDHNELMYDFFHKFKTLYPTGNYLVPGATKSTILNTKGHISIVDLRNQTELELLKKLKNKYKIVLLYIFGRGTQQSTDKDISLEDFTFVDSSFFIDNSAEVDLNYLKNQVKNCISIVLNCD